MKTLFIVKPDVVEKGLFGEIISIVLRNRFKVSRMTMFTFDREKAQRFYDVHRNKEFFPSLISYITNGPVVALELEGDDVVERVRAMIGATDPAEAGPGTIRYMYGSSVQNNDVHASDYPESAKKELAIVFGEL
jgi:nucleoside-diphosphate kinase